MHLFGAEFITTSKMKSYYSSLNAMRNIHIVYLTAIINNLSIIFAKNNISM